MFVEQSVRLRARYKKTQDTPVSLSSMIRRHYEDKGQEMSNELVQFLGLVPVSTSFINDETEDIVIVRLQSDDVSLVDVFMRNFLARSENEIAEFEGQEMSMI